MTSPFIPIYRDFPTDDNHNLQKQLVNSYQQSATAINNRVIGNFDTNATPNGQRWFNPTPSNNNNISRQRDGFRIVFTFSDSSLTFNHGVTINQVTALYGIGYDGTKWFDIPYVDVTSATNQISIWATATQIVVTKGGGAPPVITQGIVVLEYL